MCRCNRVGVSKYELLFSMLWTSSGVMSISVVRIVCPYSWMGVVFRVFWMFVESSRVSALEFTIM